MKQINKKTFKIAAIGLGSLFTITAANAQYATTTHFVNMRTGPSVHYAAIKVIPEDTAVYVKKCYRSWCNVKYGPWLGWTSSSYLHFDHRLTVIEVHEHESILPDITIGNIERHYYHPVYHHHYPYYRHYYNDDRRPPAPPPIPPRPTPPAPPPAPPTPDPYHQPIQIDPSAPEPGQLDMHKES